MTDTALLEPKDDGIASALIKARNEMGLTQAQLASQSGVSVSAIKGYETGRNMPGGRELKSLSHVLRVSPTALLFGSDAAFSDRFKGLEVRGGDVDLGRARWRMHAVTTLLTLDEVSALSQLARAIAVARHGVERVNALVRIGDSTAMTSAMGDSLTETLATIDQFVNSVDAEEVQHIGKRVRSGKMPKK
jgi:transcriptional regulator with XRE-family HTH domain